MWSLFLFADTRDDPLRSPEVIWGLAGITLALLAGAAVIYAVDQWRKRAAAGPTDAEVTASLTTYRAMYENGEITEEEYAKLRDRVAEAVKKPPAPKPDTAITGAPTPTGARPPAPGERATVNPPAPPNAAPELPPPPGTA